MAGSSTGSVQRYQLKANDTVTINKSTSGGTMPELVIGNYHFSLPTNQSELNQVAQNFQNINWTSLTNDSSNR